jgi:uncharacterized protein with NAD-binding domain and iron-sulfur cluster
MSAAPGTVKVYIIGGGVAGMSVAHELGRHNLNGEKNFDITILEKDPRYVGGKARSIYHMEGQFGVAGKWDFLPAEHGFRFFPGFYSNMDQTMKEIPVGNGKTVLDNLIGTGTYMFAFSQWQADGRTMYRQPVELPTVVKQWNYFGSLGNFLNAARMANIDISTNGKMIFATSLLRMMTSCEMRISEEYERISWSNFIDADNPDNGVDYKRFFADGITRSLAAAKSSKTSSRTGSLVFPKMLKEAAVPYGKAGRVLNAPTNEAWLNHWHRHLTEDKKVDYLKGWKCESIKTDQDRENNIVVSGVTMKNSEGEVWHIEDKNAVYVFALPVEVMAELIKKNNRSKYPLVNGDPMLSQVVQMGKSVDWMVGIIFFLRKELEVTAGHINLIDTAWAITGIQQEQFWEEAYKEHTFADGNIKGVLSMIMSNCDQDSNVRDKRCVFEMTREDIIREAWEQMKQSTFVRDKHTPDAPYRNITDEDIYPEYTFLDDSVTELPGNQVVSDINHYFDRARQSGYPYPEPEFVFASHEIERAYSAYKIARNADQKPGNLPRVNVCDNDMRLLVNQVNTFGLRPAAYTRINNLFLAGDYVRTGVDLATMEGANESGKRAANAILLSMKSMKPGVRVNKADRFSLSKVLPYRSPVRQLLFKPLMFSFYFFFFAAVVLSILNYMDAIRLMMDDNKFNDMKLIEAYSKTYFDADLLSVSFVARLLLLGVIACLYVLFLRSGPDKKTIIFSTGLILLQVLFIVVIPELFLLSVLLFGLAYFGLWGAIMYKKRDDQKDYEAGQPWNMVPDNNWLLAGIRWVINVILGNKSSVA